MLWATDRQMLEHVYDQLVRAWAFRSSAAGDELLGRVLDELDDFFDFEQPNKYEDDAIDYEPEEAEPEDAFAW